MKIPNHTLWYEDCDSPKESYVRDLTKELPWLMMGLSTHPLLNVERAWVLGRDCWATVKINCDIKETSHQSLTKLGTGSLFL